MKIRTLIAIELLIASPSSFGDSAVSVDLSPAHQIIKRGQSPSFTVIVRAGGAPLHILNYKVRKDLRDSFATLLVTRNGKHIDVPVAISDPGPVSETDYIDLSPGQELRFTHDGSPLTLSGLPVDTYSAKVLFRPDWSAKSETTSSNFVTFQVSEP